MKPLEHWYVVPYLQTPEKMLSQYLDKYETFQALPAPHKVAIRTSVLFYKSALSAIIWIQVCSEVLRVLRALDIDLPDKNAENWLIEALDKDNDGSVKPEELQAGLEKQTFYQVWLH